MHEGNVRADERSLGAFLVARARRTSDVRLAVDAGGGLVVALAFALLRPPVGGPATALGVALAASGTWASRDRDRSDASDRHSAARHRLLVSARAVAAALGVAAAVGAGLLLFFLALGDSWQL